MNIILYLVCCLIWGTTWLAIKLQLGVVDPMVSVFYRFSLAVVILFAFCLVTRRRLVYPAREHLLFLVTGAFMFCLSYWFVYQAETTVASGLVAITYTSLIFLNAVNNRIFLKAPIVPKIILGGLLGVLGLVLIFYNELDSLAFDDRTLVALLLGLLGALSASFGNTSAQVCHRRSVPVIQMALFSMVYGSALIGVMALIKGAAFTFEFTLSYTVSLFYLAAAGSVIAFLCYLTLLKNIGSDRTAYLTLVTPLIALCISTVYESYTWSAAAAVGVLFILAGNVIALRGKSSWAP